MLVKIFDTVAQMQAYFTTSALVSTKVVAIYFDGASGKHVLVHNP